MNLFKTFEVPFGAWVNQLIQFLNLHLHSFLRKAQIPIDLTLSYIIDMFQIIPPWLFLSALALLSWQLGGLKKTLLWVTLMLGILVIGMWTPAMYTLAIVLTAIVFCLIVGIPLGVWMSLRSSNEKILKPFLDVMQTMPAFVYLVPVVILLGVGEVPGVIVTMIFAIPPVIRLTNLGLRQVPLELIESAKSFGATNWQLLWKVKFPLAAPSIFTGINQAIMLSLSMVVIASMISVEGLGKVVFHGIGRLDVGLAATGGMGIILLAIVLDRVSQAFYKPYYKSKGLRSDQYGPLKYIKWKVWKVILPILLLSWVFIVADKRNAFTQKKTKKEVVVKPATGLVAEELFIHEVVLAGVQKLGYKLEKSLELEYPIMHVAVAEGDADFATSHWNPNHNNFYKNVGGNQVLERTGSLVKDGVQGIMIDKKTADKYNITHFNQLKNPEIAKIFDTDGDGKANLAGCQPGWGCEGLIDFQLKAYGLENSITHMKGLYPALIADVISRYQNNKPILFYNYQPLWLSNVLIENLDVVWLAVEKTAIPYKKDNYRVMYKGKNIGFELADIQIIGKKSAMDKFPRLHHFLKNVTIPIADVNAQNHKMYKGENTANDILKHTNNWIAKNQKIFNQWILDSKKYPLENNK